MKLEVGKFYKLDYSQLKHVFLGEDLNHRGRFFFAPVGDDDSIVNFREQYVVLKKNIESVKEWQEPEKILKPISDNRIGRIKSLHIKSYEQQQIDELKAQVEELKRFLIL